MDTNLLSAPESNNTLAKCWLLPVAGPLLLQFLGTSFSWGGSTSPEGFLPFILLLLVIIVAVVMVVLVVVVVEGSSIIKLSFVII
ncbi:hypothetical protein Tco_0325326, partial [Tanacetum coccineum]